ncbi:MAG: hypothetical protein BEN19_05270 [Epulopiscium sp. Nuni2H_MBin003]|nr:MAG: hypothetical protein BEN19_05270 [Epulopiscium sp. Nuni2H_MBin003]
MKQFFTVFSFEFKREICAKGFILVTVLLVLFAIVAGAFPRIIRMFEGRANSITSHEVGIYDEHGVLSSDIITMLADGMEIEMVNSEMDLHDKVLSGDIQTGFIIIDEMNYQTIVGNETGSYSMVLSQVVESIMKESYIGNQFRSLGMNYDEINNIYQSQINSERIILGKTVASNTTLAYVIVFSIYILILLYGQSVATVVASEKSNRAVEVLITTTGTNSLIYGKISAVFVSSMLQIGAVIVSGAGSYMINKAYWGDINILKILNTDSRTLLIYGLYALFGYMLYLCIFAMMGALVSKSEDLKDVLVLPSTLFVIGFFMASFALGGLNNILIKVASFVPFTSFMVMIAKMSTTGVSNLEIAISLGILVASTIFIAFVAARLYKLAILMNGEKLKLTKALKMLITK